MGGRRFKKHAEILRKNSIVIVEQSILRTKNTHQFVELLSIFEERKSGDRMDDKDDFMKSELTFIDLIDTSQAEKNSQNYLNRKKHIF